MNLGLLSILFSVSKAAKVKFFNDSSLQPQKPILAVYDNTSFITKEPTVLRLENKKALDASLVVSDYQTNETVFTIQSTVDDGGREITKTLYLLNETPLFVLKARASSKARIAKFNKDKKKQLAVVVFKKNIARGRPKLLFAFPKNSTYNGDAVWISSDRKNHGAKIVRGHLFKFEIIGRIQFEGAAIEPAISPVPSPRNLLLSVTTGVDLAFMVMIAISYDAYLDGYLKPNNRLISFD